MGVSSPPHQLSHLGLCAPSQRRKKKSPHSVHAPTLSSQLPSFPQTFLQCPCSEPLLSLISLALGMWRGRKGAPRLEKGRSHLCSP